jgi:hypothetical protein
MFKNKIIFSVCLSLIMLTSSITRQNKSIDIQTIVEVFMKASGGIDKWESVETLLIEGVKSKENESKSQFKTTYNNNPLRLYQETEEAYYIRFVDDMFRKTKNSKEWRSMTTVSRKLGIPYKFNRYSIFWALEFANHVNITNQYKISNKYFGDPYNVLEKKNDSNLPNKFSKGSDFYILLSKKTGLVVATYTYKNDKPYTSTQYLEYKDVNGYIIPTVEISGFSSPESIQNLSNSILEANEEAKKKSINFRVDPSKITSPTTFSYKKVQFNQPIHESVFEMN